MNGILLLLLHMLVLFVFLSACRLRARRTDAKAPAVHGILFFFLITTVSHIIPPLRPVSVTRIVYALAGEYLDVFWIVFYFAAVAILSSRLQRKTVQITLIAAISLFAASGNTGTFTMDVSRDHVFTLKPYTQSLLDRLESECIITWYRTDSFAESLSGIPLAMILEQYEQTNPQHLRVFTQNPRAGMSPEFPEKLGLEPLENGEYSGLLLEYRGSSRLVPVLAEHTLAEYELTRSLESLIASSREYPIQLLVPEKSGYGQNDLQILLEKAGFDPFPVRTPVENLDEHIPLIVQGSRHIDRQTACAIDAFLDRGGNALIMISGTEIDMEGDWSARPKKDDEVINLLQKQGITVTNTLVRDNNHYTIIMNSLDGSSVQTVPYPYWVQIPESGFLENHPVFSGVSSLQLYWPSAVILEDADFLPLVQTGNTAKIGTPPFDTHPLTISSDTDWSGNEKVLFGGIRDDRSRLIVIADEHAVSSLVDFTAGWDNLLFFINSIEWISGRDYLSILKRRQPASFPLLRRLFP